MGVASVHRGSVLAGCWGWRARARLLSVFGAEMTGSRALRETASRQLPRAYPPHPTPTPHTHTRMHAYTFPNAISAFPPPPAGLMLGELSDRVVALYRAARPPTASGRVNSVANTVIRLLPLGQLVLMRQLYFEVRGTFDRGGIRAALLCFVPRRASRSFSQSVSVRQGAHASASNFPHPT
jgi:hypothetical protein